VRAAVNAQTRLRLHEPGPAFAAAASAATAAAAAVSPHPCADAAPASLVAAAAQDGAEQAGDSLDALSLVLAATGTDDLAQVLQMSMAQGLERGAWREYRRTRRGKQRRRIDRAVGAAAQSKLFKT
ncbi:MAG: hypothetical protein KIT31_31130, partial [Deltaproteobacteria bacterium]|nr:hypothetical protein [Deltaproteobacteria bacterium]